MTDSATTIVLGVGSAHGDDQAGWSTVDRLESLALPKVRYRKLSSPIECIDLLNDYRSVLIVDAAADLDQSVLRLKYTLPADRARIESARHRGTHDFGVVQTLQLAESLGKPLDHCVIWLVQAKRFEPMSEISADTLDAIDRCVERIRAECVPARCG